MNSWRRYFPAVSLALSLSAFVSALLTYQRGDAPGASPSLVGSEPAAPITVRPTVADQSVGRARAPRPRPLGLLELTITPPGQILMDNQRAALLAHLKAIKLTLNVPDAMSFAARTQGKMRVLSAASSKDAGFFLFSEKNGRRLTAAGARKFLREFFGEAGLTAADQDEKFLSRGAGEMAWIKGPRHQWSTLRRLRLRGAGLGV